MLADDAAVRGVIVEAGALRSARPGCVHVMMATISPALAAELVALHEEAGVAYVAAPVFGVPAVAAAGQLNIMAAGPAQALATVRPCSTRWASACGRWAKTRCAPTWPRSRAT
jgi:3-hydroxyisobutyrate dehydrogenase-like beta-hydroxyacid dehydrogenase